MTRDEATKQLKQIIDVASKMERNEKEIDAFDEEAIEMAIKALEQEPCDVPDINVGDMISRQAVLDIVDSYSESRSNVEDVTQDMISDILALPLVNPQEKTGHWITTRTFMHDGEFYCDRCKCDSPQNEKLDYCPNCGAKMVEQQESEAESEEV